MAVLRVAIAVSMVGIGIGGVIKGRCGAEEVFRLGTIKDPEGGRGVVVVEETSLPLGDDSKSILSVGAEFSGGEAVSEGVIQLQKVANHGLQVVP
ncbi:hypothetical protein RhiirC2_804665 [Rhizophagus irregularis]|uniref:Uncharacterized protein n=1 Tax=Rhizophagus irregularis TaxID=588596 RepID=A0A2N1KXK4_9GLOM|nr:hypothetical protein RhiirC2_804665 [Rhizophagus irregularis]